MTALSRPQQFWARLPHFAGAARVVTVENNKAACVIDEKQTFMMRSINHYSERRCGTMVPSAVNNYFIQ
jgi:hypothetical protein